MSLEAEFQEHRTSDKTALRFVLPEKENIDLVEQQIIDFSSTPEPEKIEDVKIKMDKEFADLIPQKYTDEELSFLSENLKEAGFGQVTIWKEQNIYIFGYEELKICKELKLPVRKTYKSFNNRDDVQFWLYCKALGKLNLSDATKSYIRGQLYLLEKKKAGGQPNNKNRSGQNTPVIDRTSEKLALEFNVNERTIRRDAEYTEAINNIASNVGAKFKTDLFSHKLTIPKTAILRISELSKPEQKEEVKKIVHFGYREAKRKENEGLENITKSELHFNTNQIDFKKASANDTLEKENIEVLQNKIIDFIKEKVYSIRDLTSLNNIYQALQKMTW